MYDLIVVGAGPAGSTTAFAAASKGLRVLLLDKAPRGRDKYGAGGISGATAELLRKIGMGEAEEASEVRVGGFVSVSPRGRVIPAELSGRGFLVRRKVFDSKLVEIAESAGAEFREKTLVRDARVEDGRVRVLTGEGFVEGSYLVLATGATDHLGRRLGLPPLRRDQMGHCWGTESPFPVEEHLSRWRREYGFEPIFLFFGPVKSGYAWFFPKARHMNAGIGTTLSESLRIGGRRGVVFKEFLANAKKMGVISTDAGMRADRSWPIPFGRVPRDRTFSVENRTLAVGDAGGFVHPVTGEGIFGAVYTGWIAADVVAKALSEGEGVLAEYEPRWWAAFGEDVFGYGRRLARLLYSSTLFLELGLRGIAADDRALRLLSRVIDHEGEHPSKDLYEYVMRNFLPLMWKAMVGRGA